jgi:hypothetical protein
MAPEPDRTWQEWVIGVCVALLSLFAAWIVFGEDVIHLFPQPAGPASAAHSNESAGNAQPTPPPN